MLKMAFSFMAGLMVCGLILFGANAVIPTLAETDTDNLSDLSDNLTDGLIGLLPDIERIYQESLTLPFLKAEDKIYDEDIAEFYHELLYKSLLSDQGDGGE